LFHVAFRIHHTMVLDRYPVWLLIRLKTTYTKRNDNGIVHVKDYNWKDFQTKLCLTR